MTNILCIRIGNRQDLPKSLYSKPENLSTMNQIFSTTRTVSLVWQRYLPLFLGNLHYNVPSLAGVYKIAVNLMDGTKQVVYVGQAADLAARLNDHLSEWEANRSLHSLVRQFQCSFAVAAVPIQADRNAAERALYLHFLPSCNSLVPSGPAYAVTPLASA